MELPPGLARPVAISARYAIPVFFIISGFFLRGRLLSEPQLIFESLFKLAKLIVISSIVYVPFIAFRDGFAALGQAVSKFSLLEIGVFFHLWFLSSLFFGILTLAFVFRAGFQNLLGFISVPIGLA